MTDPLDALSKLRARVATVLRAHGLALEQFGVFTEGDNEHRLQFVVEPLEGWAPPEVDAETQRAFDEVIENARRAEQAAKADASRAELTETLERFQQGGEFL